MGDDDKARDYRAALRKVRQGGARAWLRMALAEIEGRGVRLDACEVSDLIMDHAGGAAAEELVFELLGHYPGETVRNDDEGDDDE